jgi:exo-beta-1,3-glucanase (GH17 family)
MQRPIGVFLVTAAAIAVTWWWLGRQVTPPAAAGDLGRIQCMSYAPFRAGQSPFNPSSPVSAAQIEEDLASLAQVTGCVRTYATDTGFDLVPPIAQRLGLKVLQGLWLSDDRARNRIEIDTAVGLANRYPNVINGIVVGNEVLLRGELAATDIAAALREVKAAVKVPVTYADVWEFWFRNRDLAEAVDFVTIHILPYWEDIPIPADHAADHVDEIYNLAAKNFPGREILIGEVGWPSAGRMREGALPSPSNQARILEEVMARARAKGYRVNLIEAFDQPWKRELEGTVGGYWGLFGSTIRSPKFDWGQSVSDHPYWPWQLAFGLAIAAAVFIAATRAAAIAGRPLADASNRALTGIGLVAFAGAAAPLAVENVIIESSGLGGWIRGAALVLIATVMPVAAGMALAANVRIPTFANILGGLELRPRSALSVIYGIAVIATTMLAIQAALGLVFDPRYRDFTYAALTAAVAPCIVLSLLAGAPSGRRGRAETLAAIILSGSAVYIALNETFANWQAVWFSATLIILAMTLDRQRDAQST